jgi:dTDP-4-amino-4,6-dideoxygalactose transaminase
MEFIDLKAQRECIRAELDAAIARVLEHGQFIMGPEVAELERQLEEYTGARHAITCASGTDALLIAMMAKGVKAGDAVLCPAFTYTATPESIALLGASPVFVEVEEATFNLAADKLECGLAAAAAAGLNPVGIIAVDLFGLPADHDTIAAFARANGLWVLSDAAQSFGASLEGRRTGTLGDVSATSFFPAKPLGCYGDGGAIFTDDDELAEVMRSIRLHGKGAEKYDVVRLGVNGRLDTIQAAIVIEKLKIFPREMAARQKIAERYSNLLANHVVVPRIANRARSAWAQYTIRVLSDRRDRLAQRLKAAGIPTQIYYPRPLHHQPAYRAYPVAAGGVPVAERLPSEVLSLPMHPYLSAANQERIASAVRDALADNVTE